MEMAVTDTPHDSNLIFVEAAKNSGAVAVDFESSFDVLARLSTRSVHSRLDVDALSWVR
jgi:hypothetical protein